MRVSWRLFVAVVLVAACATSSPLASPVATGTPTARPRVLSEAQAWAEVRSSLPGVPIILPTWLPISVDRSSVELRRLVIDPSSPEYVVAYRAPDGAELSLGLGPAPDVRSGDSAIGTRVRNSGAALIYVGGWPATSGAVVARKVRWVEGNYVLRIESERFSGDDLLHVAWSLDRTGAPALKNHYTRVKPGVCAAQGAAPEETVRRLISFVGSGNRDAVMDCFALELLGEYPGWRMVRAAACKRHHPGPSRGDRRSCRGQRRLEVRDGSGRRMGAASASVLRAGARGRKLARL